VVKALRLLPLLAALVGCNSLLELDEAHLDPSIGQSGASGSLGAGGSAGANTSGSGGSAVAGGEGGMPDEPATACERYCEAVTEGCTGDSTQYTDYDACLVTCPYFPLGTEGDTTGNTLQCRLNYALKAPSEPVTYCTWAGPGGDGMCGSNCEGFCTLMTATCTPTSTGAAGEYFPSNEECLNRCATLPAVGSYCATDNSITGGADTFECRLYHVAAAIYADDSAIHCPHAMGLALCVDR
jgi:hypothetical protein